MLAYKFDCVVVVDGEGHGTVATGFDFDTKRTRTKLQRLRWISTIVHLQVLINTVLMSQF